jgi:hypothetical protein
VHREGAAEAAKSGRTWCLPRVWASSLGQTKPQAEGKYNPDTRWFTWNTRIAVCVRRCTSAFLDVAVQGKQGAGRASSLHRRQRARLVHVDSTMEAEFQGCVLSPGNRAAPWLASNTRQPPLRNNTCASSRYRTACPAPSGCGVSTAGGLRRKGAVAAQQPDGHRRGRRVQCRGMNPDRLRVRAHCRMHAKQRAAVRNASQGRGSSVSCHVTVVCNPFQPSPRRSLLR